MSYQSLKKPIIAVAPMMDYTDRHFRYMLRLIAPDVLLYTEMVTAQAIIHGDRDYLLGFDQAEHPLALQLGGHDPVLLSQAAGIGQDYGYDEINLNVGCPSPRVSKGRFGACLMLEPEVVAECVAAMKSAVNLPVTVKCRIGVDNQDSYELLCHFVDLVKQAGCQTVILHARKAWLSGLSPKENRDIPPLSYETVWQLKKDFPELTIIINGGIKTLSEVQEQIPHVDGVMLGRVICSNPYLLAELQNHLLKETQTPTRVDIVLKMLPYIYSQLLSGVPLKAISKHMLHLFQGQRGAANWRRYISQNAYKPGSGVDIITNALQAIQGC